MTVSIKQIVFEINNKELTTPGLLKAGYQRQIVLQLFVELHKKELGTYIPGKRGPGCYSKFIPNEKCPATYTLFVESSKKEIKQKASFIKNKEVVNKEVVNKKRDVNKEAVNYKPLNTSQSHVLNSLWHLSKEIIQDETSPYVGYMCSIFSNKVLTIHRVRGGGKATVEEAVKEVWDLIKNRADVLTTKNINKKEAVVSALMGSGVVFLSNQSETISFD